MNHNINIQNATLIPLHGAHNPQVENTTADQQSGPVGDGRSQEPGLGSQPGPATGTALFPGLSPTHSNGHDGLKLWAKANLSSRQLLCREFCTTQKQLLHCLSPVQATCAIFDFCASRACQPGTRVFSSAPPLCIFLLHVKVPTHLEEVLAFSCLSFGSLIFRASARKTKISREEEGFPPPLHAV